MLWQVTLRFLSSYVSECGNNVPVSSLHSNCTLSPSVLYPGLDDQDIPKEVLEEVHLPSHDIFHERKPNICILLLLPTPLKCAVFYTKQDKNTAANYVCLMVVWSLTPYCSFSSLWRIPCYESDQRKPTHVDNQQTKRMDGEYTQTCFIFHTIRRQYHHREYPIHDFMREVRSRLLSVDRVMRIVCWYSAELTSQP